MNKSNRAPAADFLRVFSIFIIAWFHIWQQSWLNPNIHIGKLTLDIYPIVTQGYMFVDIMLLISGFVLMLGYIDGRYSSAKRFYLTRLVRILPCYLLCIIPMFVYTLVSGGYPSREYMLKDILTHLTFTHNFFPESYMYTKLNVALWTLAVEMQFYLIFPLLAKVFKKQPIPVYIAMIAVSALCKWWVAKVPAPEYTALYINRLPVMLDVYANGMLSAIIFAFLREKKQLKLLNLILALISCVGVYYIMQKQLWIGDAALQRIGQMKFRYPITFCGSVFLICGSLSYKAVSVFLSNHLIVFLGAVSYNFYIWHQWLAVKLKAWHIPAYTAQYPNMVSEVPWQLNYTLICFASAFIFAAVLYYAVEKPCAELLKKLSLQAAGTKQKTDTT